MLSSDFAEDIFLEFYKITLAKKLPVQQQDLAPIYSFYEKIICNHELTKNQASFITKLLEKYKNICAMAGLDYKSKLDDLQWRSTFRILDLSKKIYVEKRDGKLEICLKFPFQLKKEFDDEINVNSESSYGVSHWDQVDKVRRLSLYEFNLISIYEFAIRHNFEIDESFMEVLAEIEEIWQNSDEVIPYSEISDNTVEIKNVSVEVQQWWNENKQGKNFDDLLLAKSMGIFYRQKPKNLVEKIAASHENTFWIKSNENLFSIVNELSGKVCVILDRTSDKLSWLQNFVADAEKSMVSRHKIKVCFRDNKDTDHGLNQWIKEAGVGGKIDGGQIFIFDSKPAKWLFKDKEDVKILVSNNLYPQTNTLSRDWFISHPCTIYLSETKPTQTKGKKLVEL